MEKRFSTILSQFKINAIEALKQSPVEIFISFIYFVLAILMTSKVGFTDNVWREFLASFPISFGIIYAVNIFTASRCSMTRIGYYASVILLPALLFLHLDVFSAEYIITLIVSFLAMSLARREREDSGFVSNVIITGVNIALASLFSMLVLLLLISINESIDLIFNIQLFKGSRAYEYFAETSGFIIFPILFLVFDSRERGVLQGNSIVRILINYILSPAVLIYGAIVYAYFIKVAIIWTLPHGIAAISIGFLCGAILIRMLSFLLEEPIFRWFFNYFRFWSLPALVMLWIATLYRVNQYGFTSERVYLLLTIIALTVWCFATASKRANKYYLLVLYTSAMFLVFSYVPFINTQAIEDYSQTYYSIHGLSKPEVDYTEVERMEGDYLYFEDDYYSDIDIKGYKLMHRLEVFYDSEKINKESRTLDSSAITNDNWIYCVDRNNKMLYIFNPDKKLVFDENLDSLATRQILGAGYTLSSSLDYDTIQRYGPKVVRMATDSLYIKFKSIQVNRLEDRFVGGNMVIDFILSK